MEAEEARGAAAGTKAQPGALIATAALAGLPWAIATSGTLPVAAARIAAVGLPDPPVLVTGEDVPRGKPDPAPYLLAAERLGIEASRCVVVEDAPVGVRAGAAAGCTTIAVTTSHRPDALRAADHVVGTPADLAIAPAGGRIRIEVRARSQQPGC